MGMPLLFLKAVQEYSDENPERPVLRRIMGTIPTPPVSFAFAYAVFCKPDKGRRADPVCAEPQKIFRVG